MLPPAPSYRAAAAALVVLAVCAGAGAMWHGSRVRDVATREARAGAEATARFAVDALASARAPAAAVLSAASSTGPLIALVGPDGRLVTASGSVAGAGMRWEMLRAPSPPAEVTLGGRRHLVTLEPTRDGAVVAVLTPTPAGGFGAGAAVAFALWIVCALALGAGAWYAGPYAASRLGALASRLAAPDGPTGTDRQTVVAGAARSLGPFAAPLASVAEAADRAREQLAETRSTVAALLQINPHYVLVCTLDGHILDANPAFYAVTGLPIEGVRGGRVEVLNDVMPIEPLFELARRSLREGSSISGIEYALINREDQRRPVQVSLRAITVAGQQAVVIQATDVANQRTLEHQVAQFSDALDLMVDQRVAQITAGNAGLEGMLESAGAVLAEFDAGGGTRRLSHAAEALLGGQIAHVPHVTSFASRLELAPGDREAFVRWAQGAGPAHARTTVFVGGARRELAWRRGYSDAAGPHARRTVLLGMEVPVAPAAAAGDGSSAEATLGKA